MVFSRDDGIPRSHSFGCALCPGGGPGGGDQELQALPELAAFLQVRHPSKYAEGSPVHQESFASVMCPGICPDETHSFRNGNKKHFSAELHLTCYARVKWTSGKRGRALALWCQSQRLMPGQSSGRLRQVCYEKALVELYIYIYIKPQVQAPNASGYEMELVLLFHWRARVTITC